VNVGAVQAGVSGGRLQLLAVLPSESGIHFAVYSVSVVMAVAYVVIGPAVALLFGESRYVAGTSFVAIELLVFGASAWHEYRVWTGSPTGELKQRKVANAWALVGRIWRWLTGRRNERIVPFPTSGVGKGFHQFFRSTWLRVMPDSPIPELLWSCYDCRVAARVTGSPQNPSLSVSAGLVSLWPKRRDVVEIYLLHEFGHVANRDLRMLALSAALSWATNVTILTSLLLAGAVIRPFLTGDVQGALTTLEPKF
jgi:Zn-dependent protease with chaperone function